jgi:hypothetical protein
MTRKESPAAPDGAAPWMNGPQHIAPLGVPQAYPGFRISVAGRDAKANLPR